MVDTILDDVKELLKLEKGDPKILERIKRAAEQDEVISVYERGYVTNLVEKFLRPQYDEPAKEHEIKSESIPEEPKIMIPNTKFEKLSESKPAFEFKISPKTTKIMFGVGAVALAIILVVGVSMSGLPDVSTPSSTTTTKPTPPSGLVVDADSSSYSLGDIISISGSSDASGDVTLSIINGANQIIWQEVISLKTDGTYSTLSIAGGPGWESAGPYTLKVTQGSVTEEINFDFKK